MNIFALPRKACLNTKRYIDVVVTLDLGHTYLGHPTMFSYPPRTVDGLHVLR